jgi:hypothetical protein
MSASSQLSSPQSASAPLAGGTAPPASQTGPPCLYEIQFLDDDRNNFAFWKYHIQMVLELWDLWSLFDVTSPKPNPRVDPDAAAAWAYRNHDARAHITLTLKDEPLNSVA